MNLVTTYYNKNDPFVLYWKDGQGIYRKTSVKGDVVGNGFLSEHFPNLNEYLLLNRAGEVMHSKNSLKIWLLIMRDKTGKKKDLTEED